MVPRYLSAKPHYFAARVGCSPRTNDCLAARHDYSPAIACFSSARRDFTAIFNCVRTDAHSKGIAAHKFEKRYRGENQEKN